MIIIDFNATIGQWFIPLVENNISYNLLFSNVKIRTDKNFLYALNYPIDRVTNYQSSPTLNKIKRIFDIDLLFSDGNFDKNFYTEKDNYYLSNNNLLSRIRFIDNYKPKVCVFSIPNLFNLTPTENDLSHKFMIKQLQKNNYFVLHKEIVNYHYNGLTQDSNFVYVAFRNDVFDKFSMTFNFPKPYKLTRSIKDILTNAPIKFDVMGFYRHGSKETHNLLHRNTESMTKKIIKCSSRELLYLFGYEKYYDIAFENMKKNSSFSTDEEIADFLLPEFSRRRLHEILPLQFTNDLILLINDLLKDKKTDFINEKDLEMF